MPSCKTTILIVPILISLLTAPLSSPALAQPELPRFEPSACPLEIPNDPPIDCGYLIVPEHHDDPASATIRLPVLTIHSHSPDPQPDPILYTGGGPGSSSLPAVWHFARSPYVDDRDVIIFEQRGNLYAQPSLTCDAQMWLESSPEEIPCLDGLRAEGIDLTGYTASAIVDDLNALRQVLDYDQWNLEGTSFSTRLMLLTMEQHPEGIRSVILQSVSPPWENRHLHDPEHAARSLQVMFDDCAADPACAAAYPHLEARFYEVFSRLNAKPVTFVYTDAGTKEERTFEVNGNTLLGWMVGDAFYGPARPPHKAAYLPLLIDEAWRGNTDLLYAWERESTARWATPDWAWGLYFAVNRQDDAAAVTIGDIETQAAAYPELEGYVRFRREFEICKLWDLPAAPPLTSGPVQSDIPTLVLAGSYDPITPPEWSQAAAANLPNSHYYEFTSSGHSVNSDNPCAESLRTAFLDNPSVAPDASCVEEAPGPEFVLPGEVLIAPSMYEFYYGDIGYTMAQHQLYLICENAFAVVILLLLAVGAGWLLRRASRRTQHAPAGWLALILAWFVAILYFGFSQAVRVAARAAVAAGPALIRFGLPASTRPLFAIPLAASILTAALVIIVALAWLRGRWSLPARVSGTLLILPVVAFTALLASWGWLFLLF